MNVVLVSPFHVRTGLPMVPVMRRRSPYADRVRRARLNRDLGIAHGAEPDDVAALVVRIVEARRPRGWYTTGNHAGVLAFLIRHLPRRMAEAIASRKYDLPPR